MQTFDNLKQLMEALSPEVDSFYNTGNKAAARRARKHLQEINKLTKEFRKQISEAVNAAKAK